VGSSDDSASVTTTVRSGFNFERGFKNIVAGLVCGFLAIVFSISFGGLLLPATMIRFLPAAIGMTLFSTAVGAFISALSSPILGSVSVVEEVPLVVIAGMAGTIASDMAGRATPGATFVTIVAATMVATVATGLLLLLLGYFKLGSLVRFVPFPVVGGFMAGMGWLVFQGGVSLVAGTPITLSSLGAVTAPAILLKGAVAIAFVSSIVVAQRRSKSRLILPLASLLALLLFNVVTHMARIGPDVLHASGWLVPLPGGQGLWPPISASDLARVDWSELLVGMIAFPGIASVTVMALLMNASGIEFDSGRDVDLDRELRSVGMQGLFAGLGGGVPTFSAVSLTLLARRLGAPNRVAGLIVAGLVAATIILGQFVLDIVPTPLLGGLLAWLGGELIVEWLIVQARRLMLREYAIILLIFVVIVGVGFPSGILVGLIAAVTLFVFEYGRVETIRYVLRGSEYQSNVEGSEERRRALTSHGNAILILRLQGYLFFGTAERLRKTVLEQISTSAAARARFVIVDFHRVTGLDSSAALSFIRLLRVARRDRFTLVATGGSAVVRQALRRGGLTAIEDDPSLRFDDDIEKGLAWCENALLDEIAPEINRAQAQSLAAFLRQMLDSDAEAEELTRYFERVEVQPGAAFIEEGAPSEDIYFIESGRASVSIEGSGGSLHLAEIGVGAIVGEVAFYLGRSRTASVIAHDKLVAWRFTRARLRQLQLEKPATAFRVHEGLASILASRLIGTNRLVRFFAD
jgi:SulP family sulfate permease